MRENMESSNGKVTLISPEALLPLVAAGYDLRGPVTCGWLSSGLNDVFEVTSGDGAYVLKVYRAGWRSRDEVLGEVGALRHLHQKGVRVALPVTQRGGESVWVLPTPSGDR